MANAEAFNSGFDAAMGKKGKKEKGSPKQFTGNLASSPTELHKGGIVKKSGYAKVRKGEVMLTAKQTKSLGKKYGKRKSSTRKRVASKG
jgi:hypothetical protein